MGGLKYQLTKLAEAKGGAGPENLDKRLSKLGKPSALPGDPEYDNVRKTRKPLGS